MPYLNSRLHALLAMGLLFLAAPGLRAQEASVVSSEIRGDVDGDGQVTAADAAAVRAYLVRGTVPQGRSILPAGDANADGRVTAADAALISRYAAGVDVSRFPVGRRVGEEDGGRVPTIDVSGTRLTFYECTTSITTGETRCQAPAPDGGGAALDVIAGNPFVVVTTTSDSVITHGTNRDTVIMTVTLHNNMTQPMGTEDGTTPHASGSRMFFKKTLKADSAVGGVKPGSLTVTPVDAQGPVSLQSDVTNANWTAVYYYQFNGVVQPADSISKVIRIAYDPRATHFNWSVAVATTVPVKEGWVTITPPADSVVALDSTMALQATAYLFTNSADTSVFNVITWASLDAAVASVDPNTGVVTGEGEGTAIITATASSKPGTLRVDSQTIIVDRFPEVSSTSPTDGAVNVVPATDIVVNFTEAVNVTTSSFELRCPSNGSLLPYAISGSGTAAITLNPDADLPSGTVCEVTVKGNEVEDADLNDGPNFMPGQYVFDFEVGIEAVADVFGTTTTGNVQINSASTSPVFSVTTNDKIGPATTITFAGWNAVAGKTQNGGDVVMTMSGEGMGQFTYNPPAGYEGVDSLEYTIASGAATSSAKVALPVSGMIWFVNNGGAACTSRASVDGCGRLTNPYSTLAAFHAENNGTGNNPAAGDNIFLYQSGSSYTGPVALLGQQKLIGQDAGASLSAITGITPATGSLPLPAMDPANATVTIAGGSGGVALANIGATSGANNTVRGLSIATTGGAGLSGTSFGSPVIEEVPISVSGGPSLSLSGGTMNTTFATASSANSPSQGVSLTNLGGTLNFGSGTALSNAAGSVFFVSGGAPTITYSGGINKDGAVTGRLVEINDVAAAANITFNTGTLSASSTSNLSTGIQLSNADGTVSFNGTTTLNNGDAGIDIIGGSGGTFAFSAGTTIGTTTSPSGTAFNVNGSTPTVTFNGNLTKNGTSAGLLVDITNQTGGANLAANGTITFQNGTLNSTSSNGTGIQLSNVDGTVNFNGTTTLSNGNNGVDVIAGSTGSISFTSGTGISNPSGVAFLVNGSSPTSLTYAGGITANNGRAVEVSNASAAACGTVSFSGNVTGSGSSASGILVDRCNAGTITFSGASKSFTTQTNGAVTITNNGATVDFTNGGLVLSTTSGAGFSASGGGTVNVTTGGTNNTVSSTLGGTAVNISGTAIGGSGVTFYSVNASGGGSHGIALSNTGAGSFQVTGDGASDGANTTRGRTTAKSGGGTVGITSGGIISGRGGDGINLANTGAVVLRNVAVQNNTGDGIEASGVSGLTLDNLLVSGHANNRGVYASAVSGFTVQHSEIGSNGTSGSAGSSDLWNADLVNGTGSASVTNSNLHTTSEFALHVLNTIGTLSLSVSNTTVNGVTNGIGVGVYPQGTSNVTANLQGNTISNNSARGIQVGSGTSSSAVTNVTVNNTQFVNNFVGFDAAHGSGGAFTFSITNNNLQTNVVSSAQAININRQGSPSFGSFGLFSGTISGNTIGTAGVANSGSDVGDGINVESNGSGGITRVAVLNNTIREVGQRGIYLAAVDTDIGGGAAPTLEARVQNNNISNFEATALHGVQALLGALNTDNPIVCLNISANTVVNAPTHGIRVRTSGLPSSTPTLRLHGWDGVTAPATYFANLNPAATGASANTNYSLGGGTVSSATCTTP